MNKVAIEPLRISIGSTIAIGACAGKHPHERLLYSLEPFAWVDMLGNCSSIHASSVAECPWLPSLEGVAIAMLAYSVAPQEEGKREARRRSWDHCLLAHPVPVILDYCDGAETVVVEYGGLARKLPAIFRPERSIPDSMPDRVSARLFAAKFAKGRRVWDGHVEFTRDRGSAWAFNRVYVFDAPPSLRPARLLGFLEDFPPRERGVAGPGMMDDLRDRARSGQAGGPTDAADVGNWWPERPPPR